MAEATEGFDDQTFYSVAAQVIPVLFLALVFETRLLRSYADEPFANSVVSIGVFGAMLVGEVAALAALNGTAPSRLEKNMVWLALIVGVLLVLGWPIWSRVGRVLGHSLLKRGGSASRYLCSAWSWSPSLSCSGSSPRTGSAGSLRSS